MPGDSSIVRFVDVSLSFGTTPALAHVSFEIKAGETRVVLGAAGSGKTMLLKTAVGLVKPDSGRVYLFGQDVTDLKESELFAIRAKGWNPVPGRRPVRFADRRGKRGVSAAESAGPPSKWDAPGRGPRQPRA
jgi:ABC-type branched-subunit amino acid transport system ATPase component